MVDPGVVDAAVRALVAGYVRHIDWTLAPQPAYALIFPSYYDGEAAKQLVIPPVVLGEERRRKALRASSVWDLWSFAEDIEPRADLDTGAMDQDPEVMGPVPALDAALKAADDWHTFAEVFRQVAAELTRFDWNGTGLVPTDDFVAVAWAMDGGGELESFRASLPPERLAQWQAWGWLGDEPDVWAPDPGYEILVALEGAAVMRDPDGLLRLGPGDGLSRHIAPHEHALVRMRRGWASGGLLPDRAVRAIVADPGAVVAHANSAWVARWTDAAQPARPAVRYETAEGRVVLPPWPRGRTPLPQEQLPCPACGLPEWECIDADQRVVCVRCGYVAGTDGALETVSSMTIALDAPADGDWDAMLAEIGERTTGGWHGSSLPFRTVPPRSCSIGGR